MLKWFLVMMLGIALIGWLNPLLRRIGLGRLPGDLHLRLNGKDYYLPFASCLLLSILLSWLMFALS